MVFPTPLTLLAFSAVFLVAVACDLRTRRIPNPLVVAGIALGLLFQAFAPTGSGLFAASAGAASFGSALLGGVLGLAMFMPFYALRAFGAGDVKLLAMAGVWLGASSVLWAGLWTLVAGGVLSLAWALGTGVLRQVFANLQFMLIERIVHARVGRGAAAIEAPRTTGRMPYSIAIACGAGIEIARQLLRAS